jgi:uncharacterized protein (UPF0212 family)
MELLKIAKIIFKNARPRTNAEAKSIDDFIHRKSKLISSKELIQQGVEAEAEEIGVCNCPHCGKLIKQCVLELPQKRPA